MDPLSRLDAFGLNVGGSVYDVAFVEGTCIDLFDGCDEVSDSAFTSLADAPLASQALLILVFRPFALLASAGTITRGRTP